MSKVSHPNIVLALTVARATTFTDLRAARHAWRIERSCREQPPTDERTETVAGWEYRGSGYRTAGDAWLAASAAANKLESRRVA
jgi:phage terminase large subunit-like protein